MQSFRSQCPHFIAIWRGALTGWQGNFHAFKYILSGVSGRGQVWARATLSSSARFATWPKLAHWSLVSCVLNQQTQTLQRRDKKSKSNSFLNASSSNSCEEGGWEQKSLLWPLQVISSRGVIPSPVFVGRLQTFINGHKISCLFFKSKQQCMTWPP